MPDEIEEYDAGEAASVGKRKTKMQLLREREIEEMRKVLETRYGRAVLWRLLEAGKLVDGSFAVDPYVTAYNEGRRTQAIKLLGEIDTADSAAYALMRQENNGRKATDG